MLINSVFVAGTLLVHLVGGGDATAPRRSAVSERAAAGELAVTDSFAPAAKPKKRRPPASSRPRRTDNTSEDADSFEEDAPPPPRRATTPSPHRRAAPAAAQQDDEPAAEQEDEEDKPRVMRSKHRRVVVEEEEDEEEDEEEVDDSPMTSFPVVVPRLVSLQVSPISLIGRSFQFDTPLQKETTFPRLGILVAVEAYPLLRMSRGWFRRLGVGISYTKEVGAAALRQPSGASVSYPVSQGRWSFDVRYAFLLGDRVVALPALGYGKNSFDLQTGLTAPAPPSMCRTADVMMPCLSDTAAGYLVADLLHLRVAATENFGFTLLAGYFLGVGTPTGNWQIGNERTAKASGFHVEVGANLVLTDWLAVRGSIPYANYSYAFSGGTPGASGATYNLATEKYYGITIGAIVFTR